MYDLDLHVATFNYDTTRALFDAQLTIDGIRSIRVSTASTLPEIFANMLRGTYDVAEFGLTFLLRALDQGEPLAAIPAFPNRVFRHSCLFVNTAAGITEPSDLVGRTIGEFGTCGQDSGVWAKGILADEYGFRPRRTGGSSAAWSTPRHPSTSSRTPTRPTSRSPSRQGERR